VKELVDAQMSYDHRPRARKAIDDEREKGRRCSLRRVEAASTVVAVGHGVGQGMCVRSSNKTVPRTAADEQSTE